jgi:hypothetical protein
MSMLAILTLENTWLPCFALFLTHLEMLSPFVEAKNP